MMCQKNCGSTARQSLLSMDLTNLQNALKRHLEEKAGQTTTTTATTASTQNVWNVTGRVVRAEADFATSFASVAVEWTIINDVRAGGAAEDLLLMMDDDDEEGAAPASSDANSSILTTAMMEEMKEIATELLVELAVEEVECVGFDAEHLPTEEAVRIHREEAQKERDAMDDSKSKAAAAAASSIETLNDIFQNEDDFEGTNSTNDQGGKATFHVGGMSCAVCSGSVERLLLSSATAINDGDDGPTVVHAAVSLPTNTARVIFSPPPSLAERGIMECNEEELLRAYQCLAEKCAETVTKGGYACEILDVQVTSSRSNANGGGNDGRGGGTSLADSAARMERTRQAELLEWKRSLFTSLIFTIPLAVLHMTSMSSMKNNMPSSVLPPTFKDWMMLLLATPVQFGVGKRFYKSAYRGLVHGCTMGMDFLVVMGTTSAYLYSIIVFALQIFAKMNYENDESEGEGQKQHHDDSIIMKLTPTFETGAWLITFVTLGKYLEAYARGKTAGALQTLMELQPVSATRAIVPVEVAEKVNSMRDDQRNTMDKRDEEQNIINVFANVNLYSLRTEEVDISEVRIGEYLLVLPGGRIPTDGILLAREGSGKINGGAGDAKSDSVKNANNSGGCAYIDESAFTGEPFPVAKRPGDVVYGASVNQLSVILIQVTATGSETVISRIVRLVDEAQGNRAPIQAQADRIASIFAPCVMMLSVLTFISWSLLLDSSPAGDDESSSMSLQEKYVTALMSAISVVVVACPCALGKFIVQKLCFNFVYFDNKY